MKYMMVSFARDKGMMVKRNRQPENGGTGFQAAYCGGIVGSLKSSPPNKKPFGVTPNGFAFSGCLLR